MTARSWFFVILVLPALVFAKTQVDTDGTSEKTQQQSEKEASKFFRKPAADKGVSQDDHYLAIHIGSFLSSDSYQWGQTPHTTNTGRLNVGLTYRVSPLSSLADWALRADFQGYELPESRAVMLGLLPMILFPESSSQFPLYFGGGAGVGVFFQQLSQESFLAITYQLVAGARLFNVIGNTGFFIEGGLKNHFLLMSDGQFNGYFLTVGTIFTF